MRAPHPTDFQVPVAGIGDFTFGRRTLADQIMIRAEFMRLTGGVESNDGQLNGSASVMAALSVMTVKAPAPWDDPVSVDMAEHPDAFDKMFRIYDAMKEKEDSFRAKAQVKRPSAGDDVSVLVPEEVQPSAK